MKTRLISNLNETFMTEKSENQVKPAILGKTPLEAEKILKDKFGQDGTPD